MTQEVFTTFAVSRFIDRESVVAKLRQLASDLLAQEPEVDRVLLFGSFATGRPTPGSDADIVVVTRYIEGRSRIEDLSREVFARAPVPVDLFVLTRDELQTRSGIAAKSRESAIILAE